MINYEEMKKAVNNTKKKEFEESLIDGSKLIANYIEKNA